MSETVNLPALGESVTEGTVTRWLKQVGDEVAVDEPLVEVSTDKVDTEIPSPVAGVIEEILVEEDEDVEVGAPLVVIGDGSGAGSAPDEGGSAQDAPDEQDKPAPEDIEDAATESGTPEATDEAADEAAEQKAPQQSAEPAAQEQDSGESSEITLPALGESVTEGTVTRWLKQVGDEVAVDEPLLEVSTDKVDTEVPSPVAGTLLEIRVQEDEDAEVGQVLAVIGSGAPAPSQGATTEQDSEESARAVEDAATGSATPEATDEAAEQKGAMDTAGAGGYEGSGAEADTREKAPSRDEALVTTDEPVLADTSGGEQQDAAERDGARTENTKAPSGDGSAYVTPLVRKLAKQEGVDLSTVTGTGVGGRIRKQDVLGAAEQASKAPAAETPAAPQAASRQAADAPPAAPAAPRPDAKRGTTEKAPRIRLTIARRMRESLQESAQLTQVTEVDMTRVAALRGRAKTGFQEREGTKLTFLPFFAKAVAEALQIHPVLNATFHEAEKEIVYNGSEDIAIAVDTPRGLLVPVIKNAGDLNLAGLSKQIADLGARAKDGSITPDDLTGGTFTITNIGSFGALFDTPIINQPQVAILGTGTIVKRPMVVPDADGNDTIAVRHMCYLSLTYDHRLVDGADAGRFLQTLKKRLEEGRFETEVGL